MLINNKSKFAVIAMIHLAKSSGIVRAVTIADMAGRQRLSTTYMEQIFSALKSAGLVHGIRGPRGGYRVGSLDTTVAQIVAAVSKDDAVCEDWGKVSRLVKYGLDKITLKDLLA